jgi:hypothetical protein
MNGNNGRMVRSERGVSAVWLDSAPAGHGADEGRRTTLVVYDTRDDSSYELGVALDARIEQDCAGRRAADVLPCVAGRRGRERRLHN